MSPPLDFSPFRTNYFLLVTTVLAALGWLLAFIPQAIATAQFGHRAVGALWFALLLQAALNVGVILAITMDSIPTARLQLAAFGAIATVFTVQGTDAGVFSPDHGLQAMGAGYLVLAMVDILWVLYFTSEPESLALHVLDRLGLAPPAPPRRRRSASVATALTTTSKPNYKLGGGVGSPDMGVHEPKRSSIARSVISTIRRPPSIASLKRSGTAHSTTSRKSLVGSIAAASDSESEPGRRPTMEVVPPMPLTPIPGLPDAPRMPPPSVPLSRSKSLGPETHGASELQRGRSADAALPGVIVVTPPPPPPSFVTEPAPTQKPDGGNEADTEEEFPLRARALHAYSGSPDDPNELAFEKGEVLEIEDQEGKWWQAKKADGTLGIVPSNYLVIIS
ncbi:hypothetical protein B0H13DRAFT_1204978 [Mycena leptocephala]|nr:hypothetical protein B0H13DRAFT_1204978 [Mycena leptocephala]